MILMNMKLRIMKQLTKVKTQWGTGVVVNKKMINNIIFYKIHLDNLDVMVMVKHDKIQRIRN